MELHINATETSMYCEFRVSVYWFSGKVINLFVLQSEENQHVSFGKQRIKERELVIKKGGKINKKR